MLPLITVSGRAISFSTDYPPGAAEYRLHGSQSYYASGHYGSILVQYLPVNGFAVMYTIMHITAHTDIGITVLQPFFCCHLNLEQQLSIAVAQKSAFRCSRHSVMVLGASTLRCTLQVKKKREYKFITVFYPFPFVLHQLSFFPQLDNLRQQVARRRQIWMPNAVVPLPVMVSKQVHQLLHLPVLPLTAGYYQDNLKALFRDICHRLSKKAPPEPYSSIQDINRIGAVKEWIDAHLDQHFTIPELARKTGINEFKLKRGFKALYHTGVYGYLVQQRLLIAKARLGTTSLPIREIARQAGYKSIHSFSAAFKRAYAISPNHYRHQYRRSR